MGTKIKLISVIILLCFTMGVCAQTSDPVIVLKEKVNDGYEEMQFIGIDNNGSKQTIEKLGANYSYNSEGGYMGLMNMMIKAICEKPDKDNRYAIIYNEIRTDGTFAAVMYCTVSNKFGKYIINFARSKRNNYSVLLIPPGEGSIGCYEIIASQKCQKIEDQVTTLYDPHTETTYRYPTKEFWLGQATTTPSTTTPTTPSSKNVTGTAAKTTTNNSITGYSQILFSGGGRFEGHFVNGVIDGTGIYYWSNTHYYVGHWSNGKRHGYGIEFFDNGTYRLYYYENEKVVNRSISQSKTFNTDTGVYTGEMSNGRACGKGTFKWKNGTRFDGTWTADGKSRYGVLYNGLTSNPNTVGQWTNEKLNGYACVLSSNGKMQVGFWENGIYKYKTVFH